MICENTQQDSFDKYDEMRLHMEQLMAAKLVEYDMPIRLLCALERAGIRTMGDLVKQTRRTLRKIYWLNKVSLDYLARFLEYHGLS